MIKPWLWLTLFSAAFLACGGSSPNAGPVPQDSFTSGVCKKSLPAHSSLAHIRGLQVIDDETGLAGLRCVAWERVGSDEIKLDLYNFDGACGASWIGAGALASDRSLALHIDNPGCQIDSCGTCLYDWSFDLHLRVPAEQAVPISVAVDACDGRQATVYSQAAIGAERRGIRCAQATYTALILEPGWGQAGMPCSGGSAETCADGLVCDSGVSTYDRLCFVPCATVADCPRADVYACQAGLCRPTGFGN